MIVHPAHGLIFSLLLTLSWVDATSARDGLDLRQAGSAGAFRNPCCVTIEGYQGDAMEPFILRSVRKNKAKPFGAPQKIAAAAGFVEGPTLSPHGRSLYYQKKDGARFVIYRVTRK